jgi:hypothetical protein
VDTSRSNISEDELFFLSTNYGKSKNQAVLNEIAFSPMAAHIEQHCSAAVLFTGYHGDKVWDINTPEQFLGDELVRQDVAFGFSEIRLKSGFINIAVPYVLARNIRSIVAISRSNGMKPWSLHNNYDRPIPRRIAESSGVNREAFGMQKKGVGRHFYRLPMSRDQRRLFLQYLKERHNMSPWFVYVNHVLNQSAFLFRKVVSRITRVNLKYHKPITFWPNLDISFLMWVWATHLLRDRVAQVLLELKKPGLKPQRAERKKSSQY